jgi:hypothetical protein
MGCKTKIPISGSKAGNGLRRIAKDFKFRLGISPVQYHIDSCHDNILQKEFPASVTLQDRQVLKDDNTSLPKLERQIGDNLIKGRPADMAVHFALLVFIRNTCAGFGS